jgi:hypothetical protein
MLQRLIFIVLVLIPILSSAQSKEWGSPEYKRIVKEDCEGKIFTKSEELPTFNISKEAFEDSLTLYLKWNQAFDPNAKFSLAFLLTKKSKILELSPFRGSPKESFIKAFLHFSRLWKPAKQNNHEVCAYVKCDIEVNQDRLIVTVFQ